MNPLPEIPPPPGTQPSTPVVVYEPRPQTNGMAVAAMILGILGLWGVPFLMAILALVFGVIARRSIDRSNGREGGRAMATAGIVLGCVGMVTSVGTVIYFIWFFRHFDTFFRNLPTPSPRF